MRQPRDADLLWAALLSTREMVETHRVYLTALRAYLGEGGTPAGHGDPAALSLPFELVSALQDFADHAEETAETLARLHQALALREKIGREKGWDIVFPNALTDREG